MHHAPFCVGSFAHGLEIEFYLGVSAHPDINHRGYSIYKYKTIKLSSTNDGFIDDARYIEASVAFCNQIDLVLERLEHNYAAVNAEEREAKRQRLGNMAKKSTATDNKGPGNGGQRNRGAAGGGGNSNVGARGGGGNADSVRMTLEEANVIRHGSFKPLPSETLHPIRRSIGTRSSVAKANSDNDADEDQSFEPPSWMAHATDAAGQQLFVKVFDIACFGRHEIWMHKLIRRAIRLRNNMQITLQYGELDGRIVKVVWMGECDGCPVLVMKAEQKAERPISTPMQLAKLAQDVATTLAMLHDDIKLVHGDIKPENLIVTENGGDEQPVRVVICDFGSAHPIEDDTEASAPMYPTGGTKGYCAPESDKCDPTPASDVYSLGATLRAIMKARSKH
ncbi:kinase-like domain-containing protein [Thamnocephalis sphaerospora]|uniref:non-specific serine/threonine protein kinase n=1 Tax=Thamnocephalis sphaerospora TaxID=78915 RepID=A0A4P9XGU8_9FUNG|nr:kinase-like domain-containing protein [Thamnocephalis sphaerospora]|eukprot:RKP04400.1 kinase-like domain-containing protein [Thamnocephalis sphaerospora]